MEIRLNCHYEGFRESSLTIYLSILPLCLREAAKKVSPLVVRPVRGERGGGLRLYKALVVGPLVEELFLCSFPKLGMQIVV